MARLHSRVFVLLLLDLSQAPGYALCALFYAYALPGGSESDLASSKIFACDKESFMKLL